MTIEQTYRAALYAHAAQLEAWAREARSGGWSTQHVDPMLRKAQEIYTLVGRTSNPLEGLVASIAAASGTY